MTLHKVFARSRSRFVLVAGSALALLAALPAVLAAQDAAKAPRDTTPRKLFRSQEVVNMTITVDLRKLIRMKDRQMAPLPARMIYDAGAQGQDTMLISIGTRGNFRLKNCDFPPIRLFFSAPEVKGSIFEHQKDLKLVTRCKNNAEYEQYILQEEPIYRIYNMFTPISLRTRLLKVTYADTLHKEASQTTWAFLVEDDDQMARRNNGKMFVAKRAVFEDVETRHMRIIGLLEYMIANTDWSLGALHNVKLMRAADNITVYPMAYDFDWSGVINPRYATPDPQLPIRSVRDRLYRGPCMSKEDFTEIAQEFIKRKDAIYALYDNQKDLTPANIAQTRKYYDEFFKTIRSVRDAEGDILERCQREGN
ncbi:MAG: hypothetical protein HYX65_12515 [Gemmatimonadetes bacterium]|nr:hypothetical protein [Gemmatimonadota bacterium]